jgi:C4-dicarboxylate transporter DctQ subunit
MVKYHLEAPMPNKIFERISGYLSNFEDWSMITGMSIASILITLQVILRYVFNYSISWAEELTRFVIVWMSFVAIGMGIRKGGHICVETLVQILTDRWKKWLVVLMSTLGMSLGIVLIYTGSLLVYSSYMRGQVSSAMEIPIFLAYICIPLGGLLCTFRFLELVLKQFGSIAIPQEEVSKMKGGM